MTTDSNKKHTVWPNAMNQFSGCHDGIIENFQQLQDLADMVGTNDMTDEIQKLATKLYNYFKEVVLDHHREEEVELFPVVCKSAKGDEIELCKQHVERLVHEHRTLEKMWSDIENDIKLLSRGKSSQLDRSLASELSKKYLAHAEYEEMEFLPLAARILNSDELSEMGKSIHMRHRASKTSGYIY